MPARPARRVEVPRQARCAGCRRTRARPRTGAATAGRASRPCSSVTGARGSCSAATTARCTSSTRRPGQDILPPFPTGDIIKGSVSVDPDGFPLVYIGSRDNYFRVIAIDRPAADRAVEAVRRTTVSPDEVERRLGRQRSRARRLPLRGRREQPDPHREAQPRRRDPTGSSPSHRSSCGTRPGWDDELIARRRLSEVSIENSVAISGNTLYFAQLRWARAGLGHRPTARRHGRRRRGSFRFWTGDDTDASVVVDEAGHALRRLGVGAPQRARRTTVGQMWKLEPGATRQPVGLVPARPGRGQGRGVWGRRASTATS